MKWDKHIQYIINKTKYPIHVFAKIKKYMDTKSLTVMYYAFFHSYINYGIIACGRVCKHNMTGLQSIQRRILKIIHKNCFVENTPLNVRQVGLIIYHYEDLKEIYKKSNSKTRNKSIQLPKTKKAVSNKNSYMVALKTYNSLPKELISLCIVTKIIGNNIKD